LFIMKRVVAELTSMQQAHGSKQIRNTRKTLASFDFQIMLQRTKPDGKLQAPMKR
jgi:hypothetical protein